MGERQVPRGRIAILGFFLVFSYLRVASATELQSSPYRTEMALSQVYEVARAASSSKELEVVPTVKVVKTPALISYNLV
jgi:hypothetical protein